MFKRKFWKSPFLSYGVGDDGGGGGGVGGLVHWGGHHLAQKRTQLNNTRDECLAAAHTLRHTMKTEGMSGERLTTLPPRHHTTQASKTYSRDAKFTPPK